MANTVPIVTVDLTQCHTKERPEEGGYGTESYIVIGRDTPDDIYRVLNIDKNLFDIFVVIKRSSYSWNEGSRNPVFAFSANMSIFLYFEKKKENEQNSAYYSEQNRAIHLFIPNETCQAEKITFRKSKDSYSYDKYAFTLTFSISDAEPRVHISCRPEIAEATFRLSFDEQGITCLGSLFDVKAPNYFYQRHEGEDLDFTLKSLMTLRKYVKQESNIQQLMRQLRQRNGMTGVGILTPSGNKKVLDQMLPFYEELLKQNEPILLATFQTIVFECKRTINGVKVAKFFNDFLELG